MKTKRHTVEQIIAKLRQSEVELGKGLSVPQAPRKDRHAQTRPRHAHSVFGVSQRETSSRNRLTVRDLSH